MAVMPIIHRNIPCLVCLIEPKAFSGRIRRVGDGEAALQKECRQRCGIDTPDADAGAHV